MTTQTIFWIVLAAIIAIGIALFQYYFNPKSSTKKRANTWLAILRFISLFCLLLLLINPKFVQQNYYLEKPNLVVAIDNSSSIANFGETEAVKNFVAELRDNSKLAERFNLQFYSFGENFELLDSLSFSENQTEIGGGLRKLQQVYDQKTAPVILVTDGNQTFGQNYLYVAKQLDQPIYPVVVGDTTQYLDLKIGQLNVNRYVFLNNKFPVEVFVNYTGTEPVETDFLLKQGNQTVFRKTLNFSEENTSETINAVLPANRVGVETYTAVIEPISTEKNKANNQQNFAIETIDEKTNVLIVAGILHPDVGALKKAIESNQQRSASIKKPGEIVELEKYQLVVLYQPNRNFGPLYEKIAQQKINTFTITGTATDYGFLNSTQSDFTKNTTRQTESYLPVFNENYTVFQLENIGFADFPPLKDKFGSMDFKNAFRPILFQNINGLTTEIPLLATLENEGQRKAYLFGEGLWKWRAKSFLDERSFESFDEFIGKLVQYLSSTKKRDRLELTYDSFYNKGDQVIIEANYFDKNFVFDSRATLNLTAKNKTSDETFRRPFLLKNNSFKVNLSDLKPGEYKFTVSVENQNLSKSGEFTLVDFEVEKQFMNANFEKLQQIATNNEKQVYFLNNSTNLVKALMNNDAFKPVQKSNKKSTPLIDWYYLLAIIVLALSAEWFLRKYRGLI